MVRKTLTKRSCYCKVFCGWVPPEPGRHSGSGGCHPQGLPRQDEIIGDRLERLLNPIAGRIRSRTLKGVGAEDRVVDISFKKQQNVVILNSKQFFVARSMGCFVSQRLDDALWKMFHEELAREECRSRRHDAL